MDGNRDTTSKAFGRNNLRIPAPGQQWSWGLGIALGVSGAMLMQCDRTFAQITPDATLGVESSVVTPSVNVRSDPADLIQGGATRGTNLFHSFSDFNVGNGQRVYFANPTGIENILSRVTGNNLSNILGTLGVDGGANLFLLNPNGILFGENARLDISGSFVASTANSFVFENGTQFSATNPEAPLLLKITITPGLQYGTNQPRGTIANTGNLAVGQNLTLSAGNLDLRGQLQAAGDLSLLATDTLRVRDSVVSPFIALANGNLLIQGNQGVDIFVLNHPDSGLFSGGNMMLRSANTVGGDAHYWSGGSFRIEKLDGSLGGLYSPYDPIIRSLGDVSFDTYQGTSLHILAGGEVNIGTVIITDTETGAAGVDYLQETVQLSNGSEISIDGSLQPTLDIRAGVTPAFIGVPGVTGFNPATDAFGQGFLTDAPTSANINIGDVSIIPPNGLVFITNQYQSNTALPGGDITVTGAGMFDIGINTRSVGGDAGSVILDSRRNIAITNSGIDSSSNAGNSGDISLLANETVSVKNSSVSSNTFGIGKGGDINIQARQLLVTDGALVSVSTTREGKGGNLIVNASQGVQLMGTSADGQFRSGLIAIAGGKGDGGNVQITTPELLVTDGAQVNIGTVGEGKGGSLIINASQGVQLMGTSADGQFRSSLIAITGGKGDGGNVEITAPELLVTDGALVSASTFGEGKGGGLIVNASQAVQLIGTSAEGQYSSGLFVSSERGASGKAGDAIINTGSLLVRDGAVVNASTYGQGDGGNLTVNASQAVQLTGTSANGQFRSGLAAEAHDKGDGGDVEINTPELLAQDGALVSVSTFEQGKGGSLIVNASDAVRLTGTSADGQFRSGLAAETTGKGDGGNVEISTPELLVTDGAVVSVSTFEQGKGGSLIVNASDTVQLIGTSANGQFVSALAAETFGIGDGGNVEISTPELLVIDGALVSASTGGEGKGGSLIVNASDTVQLIGTSANGQFRSGLTAETSGKGNGGDVEINTPWLLVKDGAGVSVSTFGEGDAGNVNIDVRDTIAITGFKISTFNGVNYLLPSGISNEVGLRGIGNAGDIKIKAGALLLADTAGISTSTTGQGNAGNIFIQADDAISLSNLSQIRTVVEPGGIGKGGDIDIQSRTLSLTNGSQVNASLFRTVGSLPGGKGRGGDIRINASDSVNIVGVSSFQLPVPVINPLDPSVNLLTEGFSSGLFASTERGASGQGGDITVNTRAFRVADGAVVNAQTLNPSDGGNITINTDSFEAASGGQVLTLTRSSGRAGDITLNATDRVTLSGSDPIFTNRFTRFGRDVVNNEGAASGLFASATDGAGQAGDLNITTERLTVRDGAQVTVSSPQGQAGNLNITANILTLNQGTLSAVTGTSSPEGGANITLSGLEFLRMDNESLISASALGNANGGNVTIDSTLIVATPPTGSEGSDIIANAFQGNGGRVNVTTQGLFGIQFRPQRTPKNDITVSSTFGLSGEYVLNTPGVDPSRGLAPLPINVVDASQQIDRRCTPADRTREGSSFTITGRGGLPPNPNEPLQGESVITNWITLDSNAENHSPPAATTPESSDQRQLVEAQGWIINEQGQVVLTASTPKVTPQSVWLPEADCNPPKTTTVPQS